MSPQHGITSNTCKRFILDAGAVYTGFVGFASLGTLMGATRGGSSFTIEQEFREMPVDGAHGPMKGCKRLINTKAMLTVNFLEHTLTSLKQALVGSSSATFELNWDEITREQVILLTDYLDNIALIGEVSGSSDPLAITLKNVISDGNFELTFSDKEEGVLAVTFTAHIDPADMEAADYTEPWSLIWPTEV